MTKPLNHQNELTEMFRETIRFHGSKRGLSQKLARKALYYFEKQFGSRETVDSEGSQ
jgi:hypothetical protein